MTITEFISKVNNVPELAAQIVRTKGIMRNTLVMISCVNEGKGNLELPLLSVPVNGESLFDLRWFLGACKTNKPDVVSFDSSLIGNYIDVRYKEKTLDICINELYSTPIEKRGLDLIKPQFYLRLHPGTGQDIYLMKTEDGDPGEFPFILAHKENVAEKDQRLLLWTDNELTALTNEFPSLKKTVELIKEPAGDD